MAKISRKSTVLACFDGPSAYLSHPSGARSTRYSSCTRTSAQCWQGARGRRVSDVHARDRDLLDARACAAMRLGDFLVNIARDEIVDKSALGDARERQQQARRAFLDVGRCEDRVPMARSATGRSSTENDCVKGVGGLSRKSDADSRRQLDGSAVLSDADDRMGPRRATTASALHLPPPGDRRPAYPSDLDRRLDLVVPRHALEVLDLDMPARVTAPVIKDSLLSPQTRLRGFDEAKDGREVDAAARVRVAPRNPQPLGELRHASEPSFAQPTTGEHARIVRTAVAEPSALPDYAARGRHSCRHLIEPAQVPLSILGFGYALRPIGWPRASS